MKLFAVGLLAAALAGPALSVAGDQSSNAPPKPSSFVPHSPTHHHVYGAPIGAPIVGHSKASHHKSATKHNKAPASPAKPRHG
jgi:hypothetical protein